MTPVTLPDGRTITVQTDDKKTAARVAHEFSLKHPKPEASTANEVMGVLGNAAEGALPGASGFLHGLGSTAANAAMAPVSDQVEFHPMNAYSQGQAMQDAQNRLAYRDHPTMSAMANTAGFLGGLFLPAAKIARRATMGAKALAGMKTGAAYGAMSGGMSSKSDSVLGKAYDAASGAIPGMALGASAPVVLRGAGLAVAPARILTDPLQRGVGNLMQKAANYNPQKDAAFAAEVQKAFAAGASRDDLEGIAKRFGTSFSGKYGASLDEAIAKRDANPDSAMWHDRSFVTDYANQHGLPTPPPSVGQRFRRSIDKEGKFLARDLAQTRANEAVAQDLRGAVNPATGRNWTPMQVAEEVRRRQAMGVPAVPADIHESARRSFGAAARTPGPATAAVRRAIDQRQQQMSERIIGDINATLGPTANVDAQAAALRGYAKEASRPLYEISDSQSIPFVNELQDLLSRPSGKDALNRAARIMADDGVSPAAMGLVQDADGAFRIAKAPRMKVYDYIKQALDGAASDLSNPVATSIAKGEAHGANTVRRELLRIMDGDGSGPRYAGTDLVPSGSWGVPARTSADTPAPNFGQIDGGQVALPGPRMSAPADAPRLTHNPDSWGEQLPFGSRNVPAEMPEQFNGFDRGPRPTSEMPMNKPGGPPSPAIPPEGLNPFWKPARDAYAGPVEAAKALQVGRDMSKADPDSAINEMAGLSGFNRDFFRLGHRSGLAKSVGESGDWGNAAAKVGGSLNRRNALRAVYGDAPAGGLLDRTAAEHAGHQTWKAIRGNSQTSDRLAEMATQDQQIEDIGRGFLQAASGRPGVGATTAIMALLQGNKNAGAVKDAMASVLGESDAGKIASYMRDIERDNARRVMREQKRAKATERGAKSVASWLSAALTGQGDDYDPYAPQ